jgi:hypothetical protein
LAADPPFPGQSNAWFLRRLVVMSEDHHIVPVWFFIGVILLIYGVIILATGLYGLSHPPSTILSNLQPALWWGALLIIIGAIYVHLFRPRKPRP